MAALENTVRNAQTKGGLASLGGMIAKAGGEITRKKKKRQKNSSQRRMALGSNKSCQGVVASNLHFSALHNDLLGS